MTHLLRKGFYCCTNFTKFKIAEKVLNKFYYGDPTYILSDAIIKQLRSLTNEPNINKEILNKAINAFEPTKGIQVQQFHDTSKGRIGQSLNKNSKFSFSPNQNILQHLIKNIYKKVQGKIKVKKTGANFCYMLGSPGIAKTTSFLMFRYFNNMAIPYVIFKNQKKSNRQKIMEGPTHCKLFYFRSTTKILNILKQIYSQVMFDFTEQYLKNNNYAIENPNQFKENISFQQCATWIGDICSLYDKSNIYCALVIDQCNSLYENIQKNYKYIQFWSYIIRTFGENKTILISSMNNKHLSKSQDPIYRMIVGQTQQLQRTVLDNYISPTQRIKYGIQCLIFQLRKHSFNSEQISYILSALKYNLPMTTHLSIINFVNQNIGNINNLLKLRKQCEIIIDSKIREPKQLQLQALYKQFSFQSINAFDTETLQKNFIELGTLLYLTDKQKQKNANNIRTIAYLSLLYKQLQTKIQSYSFSKNIIEFESKENKQSNICCQVKQQITYALPNDNIKNLESFMYQGQSFTNLFFRNDDLIYCCLTRNQIQKVMNFLLKNINYNTLIHFQIFFKNVDFSYLINKFKGISYQKQIINIIREHQNQNIFIEIQHQQMFRKNLYQINYIQNAYRLTKFNNNQWLLHKDLVQNNLKELTRKSLQKKNHSQWFMAEQHNLGFDFLLTNFNNNALQLNFIDASSGYDQKSKIDKFAQKILKRNHSFKFLMDQYQRDNKVNQIIIYYIILRPNQLLGSTNTVKRPFQNTTQLSDFNKIIKMQAFEAALGVHFNFFNKTYEKLTVKAAFLQQIKQNADKVQSQVRTSNQKAPIDQNIQKINKN